MLDILWCDTCGNEKVRMNDVRYGCMSCYVATGPDWPERWLRDCQISTDPLQNVVQFSDFLKRRDQKL